MRVFFRGWKRKAGIATLALTCLITVGWMRSIVVADILVYPLNKTTLLEVTSNSQSMWWKIQPKAGSDLSWDLLEWASIPAVPVSRLEAYLHWVWKRYGFGVADGIEYINDIPPSFARATIVVLPYWLLVLPLTMLSSYLRLSQPPKSLSATTDRDVRS